MRLVRLTPEIAGQRLARSVVDAAGKVLLTAGAELTSRYIERLAARGVTDIYLVDDLSEEIVPDEAIQTETRAEAQRLVAELLAGAERGDRSGPLLAALSGVVSEITDSLWRQQGLAVELGELRRGSAYTFTHSIQVGIGAVLLGHARGLKRGQLLDLGLGALLQDIGTVRYADLIRQPRPLTPEEFALLQQHAEEGYHYLKDKAGVSLLAAHVAYQHHERLDGSGYPRGLYGDDIHTFARIAAVVDVYDALVADRPFKAGMPRQEAMGILMGMAGDKLDSALVRCFSEQIAVFAVGSPVLLSSGEVAVVVAQGPAGPGRPIVRILTDPGQRLIPPQDVDLGAEASGRTVRQVLADYPSGVRNQLAGGR